MNLPDMSKVELPKRGIVFGAYLYSIQSVTDIRLALIITVAYLIYTIAQTITDLKGKMQEITP